MKDPKIDFYSPTALKSYNLDKTMRYQLNVLGNLDFFTKRHSENVFFKIIKYKKLKKECVEHSWIYQVRKRAEEFESFSSFD